MPRFAFSDAVGPFRQALEDLGIAFPTREQALRAHIRDLANQICSGAIHPRAGARRIHMEALWLLHYPRDLMAWYFLYDGTHYPTHRELVGPELDQLILEEALNLLAEDPASRPVL